MVLHLNNENFDMEVKQAKGLVLIDFWAPWCGPCQMMAPVFEELSNEITNVKFAKLNTDEFGNLASEFSITGIPCLILTKEGKELDRIVGFAPKDQLKEKINDLVNKNV